jgi:hypothetical protein
LCSPLFTSTASSRGTVLSLTRSTCIELLLLGVHPACALEPIRVCEYVCVRVHLMVLCPPPPLRFSHSCLCPPPLCARPCPSCVLCCVSPCVLCCVSPCV